MQLVFVPSICRFNMSKKTVKAAKTSKKTAPVVSHVEPDAYDVTALRTKVLNVSQQEFATLLGLSTTTVSRWERQRHDPDNRKRVYLELLARALDKNPTADVLEALRNRQSSSDADRVIELVHLGD